MNVIDEKLTNAYAVLVLAERKSIEEVPKKYRNGVEIKVAERTIEVLGGEDNGI